MPLLLLKIKIREDTGCPSKEYNAIFEHIYQNIRAILGVKKSTVINDYENIAYSDESEQGKVQVSKCDLFLGFLVGLRHSTASGKFGYFWH